MKLDSIKNDYNDQIDNIEDGSILSPENEVFELDLQDDEETRNPLRELHKTSKKMELHQDIMIKITDC